MNEDEEVQQLPENGGQGSPDNDEYIDPDEGWVPDDNEEPDPEGDTDTPELPDEPEPLTVEDIAPITGGITAKEIEDLAADYGVTPQVMAKTLGIMSKSINFEVQGYQVSSAIIRQQIEVCPDIAKMAPKFEKELTYAKPEFRTDKATVMLAMCSAYIRELKPGETWDHLRRRIAGAGYKAQNVQTGQNTSKNVSQPARPLPPTPSTSGGARRATQPQQQAYRRQGGSQQSYATRLLQRQYGDTNANWDAIEHEATRGIRV